MKKVLVFLVALFVLVAVVGCSMETQYCSVSGCPNESSMRSNYCYEHKCFNSNCSNRAIKSYDYCRECWERASR